MAATITSSHKMFCADSSLAIAKGKREHTLYDGLFPANEINMIESTVLRKRKCSNGCSINWSSQRGKFYPVTYAAHSSEKHLKYLDSYLEKLHGDAKCPSTEIFHQRTKSLAKNEHHKVDNSLRSLENYLGKVGSDLQASISSSAKKGPQRERDGFLKNYMELRFEDAEGKQKSEDEVSDFYIIGILASINIAVFLFELATPVHNSNLELLSLPMVFGAKINTLILMGEWWRLVTPMFLHSGFFHISLGSWALFTFGRQVSQEYGSFTFLLIYLLGGISGNLISYLHMPDPTVGGTGPVFAIIGAWLVYQVQNKDVIPKDSFDKMFQNAIIVTLLSLILSNFGPIDDWAHFAAACTGIAYGYVTCPTLQVKGVSSSETDRQKRVTLVKRYADPCKSLAFFSILLLLLSLLTFVIEPPIDLTG